MLRESRAGILLAANRVRSRPPLWERASPPWGGGKEEEMG